MAYASSPEWLQVLASILHIPDEAACPEGIGKAFRCILPGHEEKHPSASIYRGNNGVFLYRDWHAIDGIEWYLLPEVLASLAYGKAVKLRKPELALWQIRSLVETRMVPPCHVSCKTLTAPAGPVVRRVYNGFIYLLACRWLYDYGEPTPFTWEFASAWCGVGERQCGRAIGDLLRMGALKIAGKHHYGTRSVTLFLPG